MAVTGIRPGHLASKAASASRQPGVTEPSIRCPSALRSFFGRVAAWRARPAAPGDHTGPMGAGAAAVMVGRAAQGNPCRAAQPLGVNRNTLRKKIRERGVEVIRGLKTR